MLLALSLPNTPRGGGCKTWIVVPSLARTATRLAFFSDEQVLVQDLAAEAWTATALSSESQLLAQLDLLHALLNEAGITNGVPEPKTT